jgi:hypothetical protein
MRRASHTPVANMILGWARLGWMYTEWSPEVSIAAIQYVPQIKNSTSKAALTPCHHLSKRSGVGRAAEFREHRGSRASMGWLTSRSRKDQKSAVGPGDFLSSRNTYKKKKKKKKKLCI